MLEGVAFTDRMLASRQATIRDIDNRALHCSMEARRDWATSLGFALFFVGAKIDSHSRPTRTPPSEILMEHLDAYRMHGDVVWYVTMLRACRIMGMPMPVALMMPMRAR